MSIYIWNSPDADRYTNSTRLCEGFYVLDVGDGEAAVTQRISLCLIYEIPVDLLNFHSLPVIKATKRKKGPNDRAEVVQLLEYRASFGRGVRQWSVRGNSTKNSSKTMPTYMYQEAIENLADLELTLSVYAYPPTHTIQHEVVPDIPDPTLRTQTNP